jgi:uncharacterized protein YndB with AHSA1/START domain
MPEKATDLHVTVSRRYAQPAEQVFDAWLTPSVARRFLFATPGGRMVKSEIDARVGGRFTMVNRRVGDGDIEHIGEFRMIDRPRRLVFDFGVPKHSPDATTVSVALAPLPGGIGCALTLSLDMRPELAAHVDRAVEGWTRILENLATALR